MHMSISGLEKPSFFPQVIPNESNIYPEAEIPMEKTAEKIAIIGLGAAGAVLAFLLEKHFNITIFEIQNRPGGHADTIEVRIGDRVYNVEAGAEFINKGMFPYLNALFKTIGEATDQFELIYNFYKTDMSESVTFPPFKDGYICWNSFKLNALVTEVELKHFIDEGYGIVREVNTDVTLEEYVNSLTLTEKFKNEFLYPFFAADWGVSLDDIKTFSAYEILYWVTKGQTSSLHAPLWEEVTEGMTHYIKNIINRLKNTEIKMPTNIVDISRHENIYTIQEENGKVSQFQRVIFATNAQEASQLLSKNFPEISEKLSRAKYYKSTIAVHGNSDFAGPNPAVANIRYDVKKKVSALTTCKKRSPGIYRSWITFQPDFSSTKPYKDPEPLYSKQEFYHPMMTPDFFRLCKTIQGIQGLFDLYFVGFYTEGVDTHENSIVSSIELAKRLAPNSKRLRKIELNKNNTTT